jgi:hypothetical protein
MGREMKKVAAALAAVNMYMEQEAAEQAREPAPPLFMSLWALSGRQEIMSARATVTARMWK